MFARIYLFAIFLTLLSCSSKEVKNNTNDSTENLGNFYAKNFSIQKSGELTLLTINEVSKGSNEKYIYVLYPRDKPAPKGFGKAKLIPVPVEKVICTGTAQIAMMDMLGLKDKITAVADAKYVYCSEINKKIKAKQIAEIGNDNGINFEKALAVSPDLIFTFSYGKNTTQKKFEELGLNTVMISEFMEDSPLGRAEWMVFMAYFFQKEGDAIEKFKEISTAYNKLKSKIPLNKKTPTVMTGVAQEGTWYQAGGKSFTAKFIEDAGAKYLWAENEERGGIPLSFESVLQRAENADYWLNVVLAKDKTQLMNIDSRYKAFRAYKNGNIYSYTARISENGGYDFYESAIVRPDVVLADLIKIFYPDILSEHELFYYQKIN
jgi:iron complex transport system substrate-binding protein